MSIHNRISQLQSQLEAVIVIQEEVKETRNNGDISYSRGVPNYAEWEEIVKPKITTPDNERRESARQELRQILADSKWYQLIIRYRIEAILELGEAKQNPSYNRVKDDARSHR